MKNVANTFRKIYKKTGNSGSDADYELIANVGVNGIDLDLMKGATTELDGEIGLIPKPSAGTINRYLRCDGTWAVPPDTNTTYNLSSFGITATAAEINKLDGLTASKTELNYTDGVTSNIQTQINSIKNKIPTTSYTELTGGWGDSSLFLYRIGDMVVFLLSAVFSLPSANKEYTIFGSCPSVYRPKKASIMRIPCHGVSSGVPSSDDYILFQSNGVITYSTSDARRLERYVAGAYLI